MACTHHKSIKECYAALWKRDFHPDCEICNCMVHTINIRQSEIPKYTMLKKSDKYKFYDEFLKSLNKAWCNQFPMDGRHLDSFCTNVVMCSKDPCERAWAQCLCMWLRYEKFFIAFQHEANNRPMTPEMSKSCVSIFEPLVLNDNCYRNLILRDMDELLKFPLLRKFFVRAIKILLSEPRSYTSKIYTWDKNVRLKFKKWLGIGNFKKIKIIKKK